MTAPGAITSPAPDEQLSGAFDVDVDVDPALDPTSVRLFLDGTVVPTPASHVGGTTWSGEVDPAALGITHRHVDVVAQVRTAAGRALTTPVRIDLLPSTGGLPPGFRSDTVVAGLAMPTSFAVIDEHRVLVAEKAGLVRLAIDGLAAARARARPPRGGLGPVGRGHHRRDAGPVRSPPTAGSTSPTSVTTTHSRSGRRSAWPVTRWWGSPCARSQSHVVLGAPSLAECLPDPTMPGCLLNHLGMHTVDDLLFRPTGRCSSRWVTASAATPPERSSPSGWTCWRGRCCGSTPSPDWTARQPLLRVRCRRRRTVAGSTPTGCATRSDGRGCPRRRVRR